jgi:hypothetical protein
MTAYTHELAEEICLRLSNGQHMTDICKLDHMPHIRTAYYWQKEFPDFDEAVKAARKIGSEAIIGKIVKVADQEVINPLEVSSLNMKVKIWQWLASKYNKEDYGDFKQTENRTTIEEKKTAVLDVSGMSDEELEVLENALKKTALKLEFDGGKK